MSVTHHHHHHHEKEDEESEPLSKEEVLQNAPKKNESFIIVRPVLD